MRIRVRGRDRRIIVLIVKRSTAHSSRVDTLRPWNTCWVKQPTVTFLIPNYEYLVYTLLKHAFSVTYIGAHVST